MPDQPGSAPSKRVSAASVLLNFEPKPIGMTTYAGNDCRLVGPTAAETVIVALRLLARAEQEGADNIAQYGETFCGEFMGVTGDERLGELLSDLAALVAPTDAGGTAK